MPHPPDQALHGTLDGAASSRTGGGAGDLGGAAGSTAGSDPGGRPNFLLEPPSIALPRGGGAIKGIDETFTVNPSNGTASIAIPMPFTPGRGGAVPPVQLSYDSGSGSSVVGLGWALHAGSVRRRTDRRLPTYDDDDVFLVAGAEDLVPTSEWDGAAWVVADEMVGQYRVRRFRPRVDRESARIELISRAGMGSWWRITSAENVTTYLGVDDASRIADPGRPGEPQRVFEWLPSCSLDDRGNVMVYEWQPEDLAGVAPSLAERHRLSGDSPFANSHLKRVHYGNRTAVFVNEADPYRPPAIDSTFLFELVVDYGEHDATDPSPDPVPGRVWRARTDPFSNHRAGFDQRTYRLVERLLMFHRFDELRNGAPTLVRSLDLTHAPSSATDGPGGEVTMLVAVTARGYVDDPAGGRTTESLPPVEFEYEPVAWDLTLHTVDAPAAAGLPSGVGGQYQWVDLYGEGLAGVLSEHTGSLRYTRNLGDVDETGVVTFAAGRPVSPQPVFAGGAGGAVQVQDLDADGRRQIVVRTPELQGWFGLDSPSSPNSPTEPTGPTGLAGTNGTNGWQPFVPFADCLRIDLHDRHVRSLDLVGDGRAHLLVSEQDAFVWYRSTGTSGHVPGGRTVKRSDEERGPAIVFADQAQTVFLADMSGDGLIDIARIRNGEVCYWPNLGYGRFGAKVAMDGAPRFGAADQFDPARLRLADLTGTGAADLVHFGPQGTTVWLNVSGNRWTTGKALSSPFAPSVAVDVSVTDLRGNGTSCLVWSSPLPAAAGAPMRYLDPMGGRKPHLLRRLANNLGCEVVLTYASSTWFRLLDERDGRPWRTRLAFPVQCLRRVEKRDAVCGTRLLTTYRYHHGCYDSVEREFRGFGMVEQLDSEEVAHWSRGAGDDTVDATVRCPPTLVKTWFHTGIAAADGTFAQPRDDHWDAEMRRSGFAVTVDEPELPDTRLVAGPRTPADQLQRLEPADRREAVRACKGSVLRREVFGLDAPPGADDAALRLAATPYTVTTTSHQVTVLQPRLAGGNAVFAVHDSESLTCNYERTIDDPRVVHELNVRVDELGHVLESATIAYGRRTVDASLPATVQSAQRRPRLTYSTEQLTADVTSASVHRLRMPARSDRFEIRGLPPASGALYALADFDRAGFHVLVDSTEVPSYDQTLPAPGSVTRRLVHAAETRYLDVALTGARALGDADPHGLVFERYEMAFSAELLTHVYGARVDALLMAEGGYVDRDDSAWWVPSGRHIYLGSGDDPSAARSRFFTPVAFVDALGVRTDLHHHGDTWLLAEEVVDAVGNRTRVDAFDYRRLAPVRTIDANGNITAVLLDALGRVKALATMGKGTEGDSLGGLTSGTGPGEAAAVTAFMAADSSVELAALGAGLLGSATARFVYDPHVFADSGGTQAPVISTIKREQRAAVQPAVAVQVGFEYSNGSGDVELHKVQAEAGLAHRAVLQPDGTVHVDDVDTAALVPPQLRWLGNGRRVRDAKGRTIEEYEPYFSTTHRFEQARELDMTGVSRLRTYDPLDRVVRIDHPDGTFSRVETGAWRTAEHDRNDTATQSDWYRRRVNREVDAVLTAQGKDPAREAEAAHATEAHADTPFVRHLDPSGSPVLEVADAGRDAANAPVLLRTVQERDIDSHVLAVVDPRDLRTISYDRDLRGAVAAYHSADGGERWMLADVRGEALRSWDERNHTFSFEHDVAGRLSTKRVQGGDGPTPLDHVFERRIYGEGRPDDATHNLRTRVAVLYDTAGRTENVGFDFAGNMISSVKRFTLDHRATPNWSGADPDAALAPAVFTSTARYDALDRVVERVTPDGSIYRPTFNPANLVESIAVTNGATTAVHVRGADYDELGRRRSITFGNDVTVTYDYDRETFRLLRLTSRNGAGATLQDLHYTYDATGNITHLEDRCVPTVWFAGQMVTGLCTYRYDATYRLVQATGREHIGQVDTGVADNWDDIPFMQRVDPSDVLTWRNYTQHYRYDLAGNMAELEHDAGAGSWTRNTTYAPDSNRLVTSRVGATDHTYPTHAAHGFLTGMPHLSVMRWNFRDELNAVATQVVNVGTPETTWYVYDGDGKRVRKIVERAATAGAAPVRKLERTYLDGVEIAVEYSGTGVPTIERHTFHVEDDHQRIALIETEHVPGDPAPTKRLVRYQSPDHLDSAQLETDETGNVISYEVFHPFGTTAYQATAKSLGSATKRYRYTGMERDEESGLEYHGARYYVPWLGRWTAPDQHPDQLDGNRYAYVKNNPMIYRDPNGMFEEPVHGVLTYRLALAHGFSPEDAATIAISTAGMDHDADTRPGDGVLEMMKQIFLGKTQINHYPDQAVALGRVQGDIDDGAIDLRKFGRDLHSLEDVGFKDAPGPHKRGVSLLLPVVGTVGLAAGGVGVLAAMGTAALLGAANFSSVGGVLKGAAGVALAVVTVALFALAAVAVVFALVAASTGHPTYFTEKAGLSMWWWHTADRAPSDPVANKKEMLKLSEKIRQAAKAANPNAVSNAADAERAIDDTIAANDAGGINRLFNSPTRDSRGNAAPSYSQIRTGARWHDRPPDVSLKSGVCTYEKYDTNFKTCVIR